MSIDASLITSLVNNTLPNVAGVESTPTISLEYLKNAVKGMCEMNKETSTIFLNFKEDMGKIDTHHLKLVQEHFENHAHANEFSEELRMLIGQARDAYLGILAAIKRYEEELEMGRTNASARTNLVEYLNEYYKVAAHQPIHLTEEMVERFHYVQKNQLRLLHKLQDRTYKRWIPNFLRKFTNKSTPAKTTVTTVVSIKDVAEIEQLLVILLSGKMMQNTNFVVGAGGQEVNSTVFEHLKVKIPMFVKTTQELEALVAKCIHDIWSPRDLIVKRLICVAGQLVVQFGQDTWEMNQTPCLYSATSNLCSHDEKPYPDDGDLRYLYNNFKERTMALISSLSNRQETSCTMRMQDLNELVQFLCDIGEGSAKMLKDFKGCLPENLRVEEFIKDYFTNHNEYFSRFCSELKDLLSFVRLGNLLMVKWVQYLSKESNVGGIDFVRIQKDLTNCKAARQKFNKKISELLESLQMEQLKMLRKLQDREYKFEKNVKHNVTAWGKVCSVVFATRVAATMICSSARAFVMLPRIVVEMASVSTMAAWVSSRLASPPTQFKKPVASREAMAELAIVLMGPWESFQLWSHRVQFEKLVSIREMQEIGEVVQMLEYDIEKMKKNAYFDLQGKTYRYAMERTITLGTEFANKVEQLEGLLARASRQGYGLVMQPIFGPEQV